MHYISWKEKQFKHGTGVDMEDRCHCINFKTSDAVWAHIAELMKEASYNRSARQCQTKWSNLTQGYKVTLRQWTIYCFNFILPIDFFPLFDSKILPINLILNCAIILLSFSFMMYLAKSICALLDTT
jgi:hypothetical protein